MTVKRVYSLLLADENNRQTQLNGLFSFLFQDSALGIGKQTAIPIRCCVVVDISQFLQLQLAYATKFVKGSY